eukprot:6239974-Prymnesium_polylepis.1
MVYEAPGGRPEFFTASVAREICAEVVLTSAVNHQLRWGGKLVASQLGSFRKRLAPVVDALCDATFTAQLQAGASPEALRHMVQQGSKAPILLIAGAEDNVTPKESVEQFAETLREAKVARLVEVVTLPGGHMAQLKRSPHEYGTLLDALLEGTLRFEVAT